MLARHIVEQYCHDSEPNKFLGMRLLRNALILIFLFSFFAHFLLSSCWTSLGHKCRPLFPPGSCLQFLSRMGFSNPTARGFFIECCQLTLSRFPQVILWYINSPSHNIILVLRLMIHHVKPVYPKRNPLPNYLLKQINNDLLPGSAKGRSYRTCEFPKFPLFFQDFHEKTSAVLSSAGLFVFFFLLIFESLAMKQDRHHPHQQSRASSHSEHERTSRKTAEESTQGK